MVHVRRRNISIVFHHTTIFSIFGQLLQFVFDLSFVNRVHTNLRQERDGVKRQVMQLVRSADALNRLLFCYGETYAQKRS